LREKDSGNQAATNTDFGGVELPRGRSLGAESIRGVGDQKAQAERRKHQALTRSETCDKTTEAIVMDGGKRGQVVKICADPTCVHHPNTPSPQQVERERAEERKRIEKEKLAITTRHRILATILQRVSAPLKRANLLTVAHYLIGHLCYSQVPAVAKRHKLEAKKDSASAQELLAKQVGKYEEAELCKLLLEISLLDSSFYLASRQVPLPRPFGAFPCPPGSVWRRP
jgi:hypothetical protein